MGFRRLDALSKVKGISSSQHRVLSVLARHENETTGQCNPRYRLIAEESEMSERQVIRIVKRLSEIGLVTIAIVKTSWNENRANSYTLNFGCSVTVEKKATAKKSSPETTVSAVSEDVTHGCAKCQGGVTSASPRIGKRTEKGSETCRTPPPTKHNNSCPRLTAPLTKNNNTCPCHTHTPIRKDSTPPSHGNTRNADFTVRPSPVPARQGQDSFSCLVSSEVALSTCAKRKFPRFDDVLREIRRQGIRIHDQELIRKKYMYVTSHNGYAEKGQYVRNIVSWLAGAARRVPLGDLELAQNAQNDWIADSVAELERQYAMI